MNTRLLFLFLLLTPIKTLSHGTHGGINIDITEYSYKLPVFAEEYKTREATIAPSEAELADKLYALLDNDDKQIVLDELDLFFDLQLSPAMLHLKGQVYFSVGEYEEAEEVFQTVLLRMPQFIRAHVDIAVLYTKLERFGQARDHLAKAVSFGENSARILGQLGYLNMKLHNAQSAISAYQRALTIEPNNSYWQQGLLTALTNAGMIDAALALSEEMIRTQHDNVHLVLNRAFLFLKTDNDLKALENLERAFVLGDKNPVNYAAAAQLHLKLNSFDRAIELLGRLSDSNVLDIQTVSQAISWLSSNSRWDVAERLLAIFSDNVETYSASEQSEFYLQSAIIFSNTNRQKLAINSFKKSIQTDPANSTAVLHFARFYHKNKEFAEADTYYSRASAFENTKRSALLGKSQVLIDLRDYRSALTLSREIFKQYPDLTYLADNIRALENMVRLNDVEVR